MKKAENIIKMTDEAILNQIYFVRDQKVMLYKDLAQLYGVETRILKQSVKRNLARFPEDFMFELSNEEMEFLVSQNVIPALKHYGGAKALAFTEQGVAMLPAF